MVQAPLFEFLSLYFQVAASIAQKSHSLRTVKNPIDPGRRCNGTLNIKLYRIRYTRGVY